MNNFWLSALCVGVGIILMLAFYAGKLLKQVTLQKKQQEAAQLARQQSLNKHDKKVFESVLLITRAMLQEQCEFDEGSWRLSVLLSSLKTVTDLPVKFPATFTLYDEIKDLAILDARKALTKKQRMREDYQRMTALNKMQDKVMLELDSLLKYTTEQLEHLTA